MNIEFDCPCGARISEFTMGDGMPAIRVACTACDARYAVTITDLCPGTATE